MYVQGHSTQVALHSEPKKKFLCGIKLLCIELIIFSLLMYVQCGPRLCCIRTINMIIQHYFIYEPKQDRESRYSKNAIKFGRFASTTFSSN